MIGCLPLVRSRRVQPGSRQCSGILIFPKLASILESPLRLFEVTLCFFGCASLIRCISDERCNWRRSRCTWMVLIIVDTINPSTKFYPKQAKLASICNWPLIKHALLCISRYATVKTKWVLKSLCLMSCLNNDCGLSLNSLLVFLDELYLLKITFQY